jgi:hypothetical protein
MIGRLVVSPRLAATGIGANVNGGLAIDTDALDGVVRYRLTVFFLDIGEDRVSFWNFFWGLAFSTERSR